MKSKSLVLIAVLALLNILGSWIFYRWDLTEDKRYSLSEASKILVENLDETLEVEVYLDAPDMPKPWQRLRNGTEETLKELKFYAGGRLNYRFFDPLAIEDKAEKDAILNPLFEQGIQLTNIFDQGGGKKSENLVIPYAKLSYKGKSQLVSLTNFGGDPSTTGATTAQEKLNQSYENLEYSFATAIKQISNEQEKSVGLLMNFTDLKPIDFAGLITSLQTYYKVYLLDTRATESFDGLDAIILPKPTLPLDDSSKFKIDQYLMKGGRGLFFIDGLKVDSLNLNGTFAQALDINMDDMLFKYGIKLNKNIVKDGLSSANIPLVVGSNNGEPDIQFVPYKFYPLISNYGNSLITKNLKMVVTKYVSSIDTLPTINTKKTPLLLTSKYTKTLNAPAFVTYNDARKDAEEEVYNEGEKALGYLVEGELNSLYANRILPSDPRSKNFQATSVPTKLLVVADGDFVVNDVNLKKGEPYPLGFDKYTQQLYGNNDFIMNAMAYMIDEGGIINAKSKEVAIRPLDMVKVRRDKKKLQMMALIFPSLIIVLIGLVINYFWKRQYGV